MLKLIITHQLLVYVDNVNLRGENINNRKKNKEPLLVTSEVVSQEINVQESICSCLVNRKKDRIII